MLAHLYRFSMVVYKGEKESSRFSPLERGDWRRKSNRQRSLFGISSNTYISGLHYQPPSPVNHLTRHN